jgi:hypothetical protein
MKEATKMMAGARADLSYDSSPIFALDIVYNIVFNLGPDLNKDATTWPRRPKYSGTFIAILSP